jgi:hypothetical protein
LFFDPLIRDRDGNKSESGPVMHIPDNFLETVIRAKKILKFFDADPDPESKICFSLDPCWKISNPGSGINVPDPQFWKKCVSFSP